MKPVEGAAHDEVGGALPLGQIEQFDWVRTAVGTQDQVVPADLDIAEAQQTAVPHSIDRPGVARVVDGRVVMAVDEQDAFWRQDGAHRLGLLGGDAHCDEALPVSAAGRTLFAKALQQSVPHPDQVEEGIRGDMGVVDRGGLGDEGDGVGSVVGGNPRGSRGGYGVGNEIGDAEPLGAQHGVEGTEAEHSFPVEEVGDVGGNDSGLASEQCRRQDPPFYAAEHFEAESFVQLGEIHEPALDSELSHSTHGRSFQKLKLRLFLIDSACPRAGEGDSRRWQARNG